MGVSIKSDGKRKKPDHKYYAKRHNCTLLLRALSFPLLPGASRAPGTARADALPSGRGAEVPPPPLRETRSKEPLPAPGFP